MPRRGAIVGAGLTPFVRRARETCKELAYEVFWGDVATVVGDKDVDWAVMVGEEQVIADSKRRPMAVALVPYLESGNRRGQLQTSR